MTEKNINEEKVDCISIEGMKDIVNLKFDRIANTVELDGVLYKGLTDENDEVILGKICYRNTNKILIDINEGSQICEIDGNDNPPKDNKLIEFIFSDEDGVDDKDEKIQLSTLKQGDTFDIDGHEWIILEQRGNETFCLSNECLVNNSKFDEDGSSNWKESSLRDYLNGHWLKRYMDKNMLNEFKRDLTKDDGTNWGDICFDYISLLSCDEYRKYRRFIPKVGKWYWTITSRSTDKLNRIRCVNDLGMLENTYAGTYGGVRPCVCFNSAVMVNKKSEFTEEDNGDNINE